MEFIVLECQKNERLYQRRSRKIVEGDIGTSFQLTLEARGIRIQIDTFDFAVKINPDSLPKVGDKLNLELPFTFQSLPKKPLRQRGPLILRNPKGKSRKKAK